MKKYVIILTFILMIASCRKTDNNPANNNLNKKPEDQTINIDDDDSAEVTTPQVFSDFSCTFSKTDATSVIVIYHDGVMVKKLVVEVSIEVGNSKLVATLFEDPLFTNPTFITAGLDYDVRKTATNTGIIMDIVYDATILQHETFLNIVENYENENIDNYRLEFIKNTLRILRSNLKGVKELRVDFVKEKLLKSKYVCD